MRRTLVRNPKGARDWLPDEIIKQEFVRKSLVKVFELWGYQPIQTPILVNLDTVFCGGNKLSDSAFKLIGNQGELLALRADLTTPIARVTAERLRNSKFPLRFYYVGKVFRYHARKTTNERELYQIGIELIGIKEGISDFECLSIFLDCLKKLGLKNYSVLVNHAAFWGELFKCFGDLGCSLYEALSKKDLILYNKTLLSSKVSKIEKEFLGSIIHLNGKKEIINNLIFFSRKIKKLKIKNLIIFFQKLVSLFEENVEIDLSLTSDMEYYTGIYFEAVTPYLGRIIGSGGRYDQLIKRFGFDKPAIGFSFCLEDLLLSLENQNKIFPKANLGKALKIGKNLKQSFRKFFVAHNKNKILGVKY